MPLERRTRIRILLVDRHSLFRQAVRELLDRQEDLEVVADAGTEGEILVKARRYRPDVALIGSDLSDGDGIQAVRSIREGVPGCRTVIVASTQDKDALLRAVEAGANGFITKECALSELMMAMRAVHRGETLVPPSMLGELLERLVHRQRQGTEASKRISQLTRRERQVLALLAEGGNKESIAGTLVISPGTARTHIQHVLTKLGVHSRLEAATFARRGGILQDVLRHEVPALTS